MITIKTPKTRQKIIKIYAILKKLFRIEFEQNFFVRLILHASVDNILKYDGHILALKQELARGRYAVGVTAKELGPEIAKLAYFSLAERHIYYRVAFSGQRWIQDFVERGEHVLKA